MAINLLAAIAPVCLTYILNLDKTGLEITIVHLQNENRITDGGMKLDWDIKGSI